MKLFIAKPFSLLLLHSTACLVPLLASAQSVTIPAGVPLRVQIDHRYRVHAGYRIEGHLVAAVDHIDHVVLPANTHVIGTILGMRRTAEASRTRSFLDGQFTPPSVPAVRFDSLTLRGGTTLPIQTAVTERDSATVTMNAGKKPGLRTESLAMLQARKRELIETLHHPNLGDRLEKWICSQLPWSPHTIWTGTQYDAELTAPLTIPGTQPEPLPDATLEGTPIGIVDARLVTPLNSANARQGDPVSAVLTRPLLTPDGTEVLFPEGATMSGIVTVARPARWLARNGQLRFTFRGIARENAAPSVVHGQLAGAEARPGDRINISSEGIAKSSSGAGKYLAPIALGVLASSAFDGDATSNPVHSGVDSNGFGFAARILVMSSANAVLLRTFAVFAVSKSIFYRWVARGHDVEFAKDTRVQILLNPR